MGMQMSATADKYEAKEKTRSCELASCDKSHYITVF